MLNCAKLLVHPTFNGLWCCLIKVWLSDESRQHKHRNKHVDSVKAHKLSSKQSFMVSYGFYVTAGSQAGRAQRRSCSQGSGAKSWGLGQTVQTSMDFLCRCLSIKSMSICISIFRVLCTCNVSLCMFL